MQIIKMFKYTKEHSKIYFPYVKINTVQKKLEIWANRMKYEWFPDCFVQLSFDLDVWNRFEYLKAEIITS